MRLRTVLLAATLAAAGCGPALADGRAAADDYCHFAVVDDPTSEPGTLTGELSGGPTIVPDAQGLPRAGTLSCWIQIDESTHVGIGPSVSGHGFPVVSAGPSQVSLHAEPWNNVFLCASFHDDVLTYTEYWDSTHRRWDESNHVSCELAVPASQDPPVERTSDCPYGNVTGDITYNTAVTTTKGRVTWTMNLHADCVGSGPVAGHYDLTFTGSSDESCSEGTGGATVTGTGPNGAITGTWSFTRGGIHYYGYAPRGNGHFTDSLGEHQMAWWLDILTGGNPCPGLTADVAGHGLITL